jgi:hypothetical protein
MYPLQVVIEINATTFQCVKIAWCLFQAGFLVGIFYNPEDAGDRFLRNVG